MILRWNNIPPSPSIGLTVRTEFLIFESHLMVKFFNNIKKTDLNHIFGPIQILFTKLYIKRIIDMIQLTSLFQVNHGIDVLET